MVVVGPSGDGNAISRSQSAPSRTNFMRAMALVVHSSETLSSGSCLVEKRQQKLVNNLLQEAVITHGTRFSKVLDHWLRFNFFTLKHPLPVLPSFDAPKDRDGICHVAQKNRRKSMSDEDVEGSPDSAAKKCRSAKTSVFVVPRLVLRPEKYKEMRLEHDGHHLALDEQMVGEFRDKTFQNSAEVGDWLIQRLVDDTTHYQTRRAVGKPRLRGSHAAELSPDPQSVALKRVLPDAHSIASMACRASSHSLLTSELLAPRKGNLEDSGTGTRRGRQEVHAARVQILRSVTVPELHKEGFHAYLTYFGISSHEISGRMFAVLSAGKDFAQFSQFFKFVASLENEDAWCESNIFFNVVHSCLGNSQDIVDLRSLETDIWNFFCPAEQLRLERASERGQVRLMSDIIQMLAFNKRDGFAHYQSRCPAAFKLIVRLLFPLANEGLKFIDEKLHLTKRNLRSDELQGRMEIMSLRQKQTKDESERRKRLEAFFRATAKIQRIAHLTRMSVAKRSLMSGLVTQLMLTSTTRSEYVLIL
eukprot:GEMP01023650.1.p1 GENE.GEMP01023650.1~~GEMP01023650.1.p1  ORF type:complete len:531 (+),score=64.74 GEMP01023650.1:135-1727(+)